MAKSKLLLYLAGFFFFISAFVFLPRVFADTTDFENAVRGDQANRQDFVNGIVNDLFDKGAVAAGGCITPDCQNDPELSDGALFATSRAIAWTFHQPADTQLFIADTLKGFGIAQPAYAQGLGFSALAPILEIWKTFRNIAYVIFVLVMLVIGFAIMFRKNLGGQAEVTVQQALPKIVVALLMVTFSYAIAGLLIDLMYVAMFFLITIFNTSGLVDTTLVSTAGNGILSQNIFQIFWGMISQGFATKTGIAVSDLIQEMLGDGGIIAAVVAGLGGFIVGPLATLIVFVVLLIAMFKTFFALIKVYVEIILSIVFAPLILALGAIQSNAFGNWVKGLAVNLAVFPVLLVFILVGYMFIGTSNGATSDRGIIGVANAQLSTELNESGFVPPFIPGRGSIDGFVLIALIGLVLAMSEVPAMVTKYKPKGPFDDLSGVMFRNIKEGNRYAFPGAGVLAGAGLLGIYGGATGAWRGSIDGIGGMLGGARRGFTAGARLGAQEGLSRGRGISGTVEQAIEGKLPDPNAWENIILAEGREKRKAQQEANRKKFFDAYSRGKPR